MSATNILDPRYRTITQMTPLEAAARKLYELDCHTVSWEATKAVYMRNAKAALEEQWLTK